MIVFRRMVLVIVVAAAPIYIIGLIHAYGSTVPLMDQWELVPVLEKVHAGTLSLADLWAQHNEHRILFPRLLMVTLACATRWNIMYELYANVVLAGMIFLFLYLLLRRTIRDPIPVWFAAAVSFIVFSPAQCENWTWGWSIQIFMSMLFSIVAIWALAQWPNNWTGLLVAIVAGVAASYSFSTGLLTWSATGVMLILAKKRNRLHILCWAGSFVAVLALYYYGYSKPSNHPALFLFLHRPLEFAGYVLAYLGTPLGLYNDDVAIVIGFLLLASIVLVTVMIRRSHAEEFTRMLPWLALALLSFLSAVATGVGRLGLGVGQATVSRYTTLSSPFIVATAAISLFLVNEKLKMKLRLPISWTFSITAIATWFVISYALTFTFGTKLLVLRHAMLLESSFCLEKVERAPDECLELLYPYPGIVRQRAASLLNMGMALPVRGERTER